MNKSTLLLLVLPLAFFFCNNEPITCEKVKNGRFFYYTKKNRQKINIDRFDSLQIETDAETGGSTLKNKIVWTGPCKFQLFLNALSETKLSKQDSIFATIPCDVEITFLGSEFYVCLAKMDAFGKHLEFRDTMYYRR